jgi:dihydrofolate synthase/folylpolyglutamate synthase
MIERLRELPKFGSGVGLHRMGWLCADLELKFEGIKVTGSNGKGSVCAMLAAVFEALGISCGLYTSPHLLRFNERIALNGRPIADPELAAAAAWMWAKQEEYAARYPADGIGAFEAFTAMALYHYAAHRPQVVVAEAGIGGRYDSTRVIPGRLAGLVSLDLEHTQLLGPTLELIAYDKADLCPPGGTLVVGALEADLLRRLRAYCDLRGVHLISVDERCKLLGASFEPEQMTVDLNVDGLELPGLRVGLVGRHQINNLCVATLLLREWAQENQVSPAALRRALYEGLAAVKWPGRFQKIQAAPDIFIDVGHSPAAIAALVETVQRVLGDQPILLLTGVSYNKEVAQIVAQLVQIAAGVICSRAHHNGSPVALIAEIARQRAPTLPLWEAEPIEEAVRLAEQIAREQGMTVLVAGGLFLAIEAMVALQGGDPQRLCFF